MEIINIIIAVNLKFVVEMILPNSTGINIPITDWVVFFLNSYSVRSEFLIFVDAKDEEKADK